MKKQNYMKLEFPGKHCNVDLACEAVAAFMAQLSPNKQEYFYTKMAVTEMIENCIYHAYKNEEGIITIRCSIIDEETLEIIVRDKGCGVADIEQAIVPMFTTMEAGHAGLGFTIAEKFMTKFKISSKVGKGTTIRMVKRLQG